MLEKIFNKKTRILVGSFLACIPTFLFEKNIAVLFLKRLNVFRIKVCRRTGKKKGIRKLSFFEEIKEFCFCFFIPLGPFTPTPHCTNQFKIMLQQFLFQKLEDLDQFNTHDINFPKRKMHFYSNKLGIFKLCTPDQRFHRNRMLYKKIC